MNGGVDMPLLLDAPAVCGLPCRGAKNFSDAIFNTPLPSMRTLYAFCAESNEITVHSDLLPSLRVTSSSEPSGYFRGAAVGLRVSNLSFDARSIAALSRPGPIVLSRPGPIVLSRAPGPIVLSRPGPIVLSNFPVFVRSADFSFRGSFPLCFLAAFSAWNCSSAAFASLISYFPRRLLAVTFIILTELPLATKPKNKMLT